MFWAVGQATKGKDMSDKENNGTVTKLSKFKEQFNINWCVAWLAS